MINGLSDVPMIHFLCYRQLEMNVKMLFYIRLNRNGVTEYGCFYICFYFGEGCPCEDISAGWCSVLLAFQHLLGFVIRNAYPNISSEETLVSIVLLYDKIRSVWHFMNY